MTTSVSTGLLRRAEAAAAATRRRRQIGRIRRGDDITVVLAGDEHYGQIGRVIERLPSADEFDVPAHPAALFTATLNADARCRRHHRPRVEGALKSVHARYRSRRTRWLRLV